jgi:parvulin-like peptidyl-prolyl isomerase
MLLRRNAALRKLVADDVQITPALIQQAYDQRYGQLTRVRMILSGSLKSASEALKRAQAGESFIDLAIELSEDASRAQGGLLPPISGEDPSWPQALREAAVKLEPGQISEPVALDAGWAILKCEKKIDQPKRPLAEVRTELRDQVRLRLQRVRMQQLARALIEKADVTVLDADLDRSWKQQRGEFLQPGQ